MKIVKEHINEKFREESDPIKDMNIGVDVKIRKIRNKVVEELQDNWNCEPEDIQVGKIKNGKCKIKVDIQDFLQVSEETLGVFTITITYPTKIEFKWDVAIYYEETFSEGSMHIDKVSNLDTILHAIYKQIEKDYNDIESENS